MRVSARPGPRRRRTRWASVKTTGGSLHCAGISRAYELVRAVCPGWRRCCVRRRTAGWVARRSLQGARRAFAERGRDGTRKRKDRPPGRRKGQLREFPSLSEERRVDRRTGAKQHLLTLRHLGTWTERCDWSQEARVQVAPPASSAGPRAAQQAEASAGGLGPQPSASLRAPDFASPHCSSRTSQRTKGSDVPAGSAAPWSRRRSRREVGLVCKETAGRGRLSGSWGPNGASG